VKQAYEETKDGIPYSDQKEYLAELKAREEAMEAIKAEELERVENAMNATLYKEMGENKGLILKEDVNKFYEEGHPMRKVWSDLADQGSVTDPRQGKAKG
jgi:hypothetical protein